MILIFALLLGSTLVVTAQQAASAPAPALDWKALAPQIQTALGDAYSFCNKFSRITDVIQIADVTDDGVQEAVVAYCRTDVYTSDVALIRIEEGKPVLARFRDAKGTPIAPKFRTGASIKSGEGLKLLRARKAAYDIQWHIDKTLKMDSCTVSAYVWAPTTATFDQNDAVSKEIGASECGRLSQEFDEQAQQFPHSKKGH